MSWFTLATLSAALSGIVAIFDSHFLSRRLSGLGAYLLPLGVFHFIVALVILAIEPFPAGTQTTALLAALGSGVFTGFSSIIMLNIVRSGEISRIIPVINTSPIFVALMAIPLLGEKLDILDWSGVILTVAGAILISVQQDGGKKKAIIQKTFFALLFCSLLYAVSNIVAKYALDSLSFWTVYGANASVFGLIFILFSLRRSTYNQISTLEHRNRVIGLIVLGQSIVVVAILLSFLAMDEGPVSLVSTVIGVRPVFVFIYTLVISRFFPAVINERTTGRIITLKLTAIAMIVGGVAMLTL